MKFREGRRWKHSSTCATKAKAKDHDKKGKGEGKGKSMSPEQKKEWPCVFHYTKEGGCLKGKDCPYSHNPKHKHKLDNNKGNGKGDGKAAMHGGKESARKGNSANTSTLTSEPQSIRSCA